MNKFRDNLKSDRWFQLWEYQVSHGRLLIRSPVSPAFHDEPERTTNQDLLFLGVEYVEVQARFKGFEIVKANQDEVERLEKQLGRSLEAEHIRILLSEGRRFVVVAFHMRFLENDWEMFQSPFEQHFTHRDSQ